MTQTTEGGGAAGTLGEAAEQSRDAYHDQAKGASKRAPGRKDPEVGKADKTNTSGTAPNR